MKWRYVLLSLILLVGCSRNNNPMVFSKIEPPPVVEAPPELSLFDMYLEEKVDTDYMLSWFFRDYKLYRYKLFYIKSEIESKEPFNRHDTSRILLLQYAMNDVIHKFNDRNFFSKSADVIDAAFASRKKEKSPEESLVEIKTMGASAKHISDNLSGYMGSFARYGFNIEEVKLLDDKRINTQPDTNE